MNLELTKLSWLLVERALLLCLHCRFLDTGAAQGEWEESLIMAGCSCTEVFWVKSFFVLNFAGHGSWGKPQGKAVLQTARLG